ncbi:hypothetical protein N431DRAFT_118594 [Stipitochalara longipes BDJ]|nr:hypothetical protein N431DRAFT_118594 [Stipitochalara longipes BDJ]
MAAAAFLQSRAGPRMVREWFLSVLAAYFVLHVTWPECFYIRCSSMPLSARTPFVLPGQTRYPISHDLQSPRSRYWTAEFFNRRFPLNSSLPRSTISPD